MAAKQKNLTCQVCKKEKTTGELIPALMVREPIAALIRKEHPGWSSEGFICKTDLNHYRSGYVKGVIESEKGDLTVIEKEVIKSLEEEELVSRNVNSEFEGKRTVGERMADRMAEFGGSWKFIIIFGGVLVVWLITNTLLLTHKPFDPYPFILLNLILSCLAAIQAPIIMMSQNRQEAKDRLRAQHDYQVNLKSEVEIRNLHEKIDHLVFKQWQRLLEIQEIQTELMEELAAHLRAETEVRLKKGRSKK